MRFPCLVVARADVGRHHRLQRARLLAPAELERPQRARGGGEDDVVRRAAEAAADRPQVVERARHAHVVALRAALEVERGGRGGREHGVRERAHRAAGRAWKRGSEPQRRERERGAVAGAVHDGAAEPLGRRRRRARAIQRRGPPASGRSGSRSSIRLVSCIAATPSTMQWCALPTMATPPPGRSSWTHMSHSGRPRSSGNESTRSTSSSSVSPGSATCTWSPASKRSSSTHSGSCSPNGTSEQPLAPARRLLHPAGDQRPAARRPFGRGPCSGALELRHPSDMHRRARALDREERCVEGGQSLAQGAGTGRIMIRFVPPVVPSRPAVITTNAPGGSPA